MTTHTSPAMTGSSTDTLLRRAPSTSWIETAGKRASTSRVATHPSLARRTWQAMVRQWETQQTLHARLLEVAPTRTRRDNAAHPHR